jgi:hypothetical protein
LEVEGELVTSGGGVVLTPGSASTPADLAAAQAQQALVDSSLEKVRKAADSWRTGLLAVLALIGTLSVVKGRENFVDLAAPAPLLIGMCLGLALLAAAIGSYRAMRAAYGEPRQRRSSGVLLWDHQDATDAVRHLNAAKWDFFIALPAVALAVALAWYAPKAAGNPLALVRADDAGSPVCGELVSAGPLGITIKEDGSPKLIAFNDLRSLALTEDC